MRKAKSNKEMTTRLHRNCLSMTQENGTLVDVHYLPGAVGFDDCAQRHPREDPWYSRTHLAGWACGSS
jgi:hypothetical protein